MFLTFGECIHFWHFQSQSWHWPSNVEFGFTKPPNTQINP